MRWREWLRISNALNLREQPTMITTVTDGDAAAGDGPAPSQGPLGILRLTGARIGVAAGMT